MKQPCPGTGEVTALRPPEGAHRQAAGRAVAVLRAELGLTLSRIGSLSGEGACLRPRGGFRGRGTRGECRPPPAPIPRVPRISIRTSALRIQRRRGTMRVAPRARLALRVRRRARPGRGWYA